MSLTPLQALWEEPQTLSRLPIPDAQVFYLPRLPLDAEPDVLLKQLIVETPWRAESIVLWGRKHAQPRLSAWVADSHVRYRYSGLQWDPLPWTALLKNIRNTVEAITQHRFNSVLLNYYRDHRDSMGLHSDDEPELGEQPVIASVSLGEERVFVLKHKTNSLLKSVRLPLASGSLLLMAGDTQKYWKHRIDKQTQPCGPRVNLTFRHVIVPTQNR